MNDKVQIELTVEEWVQVGAALVMAPFPQASDLYVSIRGQIGKHYGDED